jgi:hypothetical protein
MNERKKFTSLWSLIESMQRKLEGEGLEEQIVDAAVTRGLETLLRTHGPTEDEKGCVGFEPLPQN